MSYNKLVSQSGKIFYTCDKNCPKCKEWNTKGNFWKLDIFFPLHCPMCYHAGYTKDFHIVGNFFICFNCLKKYKKRLREILHKRN